MNAPKPILDEEKELLLTQWQDGMLSPTEEARMAELFAANPQMEAEAAHWESLRALMQQEMPREITPPSADFFNSQILREISKSTAAEVSKPAVSWWHSLWSAWLAPLAATAAVLLVSLYIHNRKNHLDMAAGPYSPDPQVKATLVFNEDANATVLDLENLKMEDQVEIRPFSLASTTQPSEPGMPTVYYAANDPSHVVFTMGWDASTRPFIHEMGATN